MRLLIASRQCYCSDHGASADNAMSATATVKSISPRTCYPRMLAGGSITAGLLFKRRDCGWQVAAARIGIEVSQSRRSWPQIGKRPCGRPSRIGTKSRGIRPETANSSARWQQLSRGLKVLALSAVKTRQSLWHASAQRTAISRRPSLIPRPDRPTWRSANGLVDRRPAQTDHAGNFGDRLAI